MEYDFFIVKKIKYDSSKLNAADGMTIVTFRIEALEKYSNNPDYEINASNRAGTLKSKKQGCLLQIDIHDDYLNTWLYKMGDLPEDEQAHFSKFNIYPKELSQIAYNRWTKGLPE